MKNEELAKIFTEIAQILQIKGDNPFRIRAYERAAQNIEGLSDGIENYAKQDKLTQIPGIGKDLANKIEEYINTGKLKAYEDLKKSVPFGLLELLNIPSLGPKTTKILYEKLKIRNLEDLESAIKKNRIQGIFGIKQKTVDNIIKGIQVLKRGKERLTLAQATLVAKEFIDSLGKLSFVKKLSAAGSLRRQKETVRDIDILVITNNPEKVIDTFVKLPSVKDILAKGKTKASIRTENDVQVDCRLLEEKSFGAALLYFTGSKNFNIKLRQIALKKELKINEYGVFSATKRGGKKDKFVSGRTEEDIFRLLGMSYIEPELREDSGEIELAIKSRLPSLIESKDIKGDLHAHSTWSDGRNSIQEMAEAAKSLGFNYIAITDHSQSLRVASGISVSDLKKKKKEIERINKAMKDFRVLFATEVEIDSQGKIDYKDNVLAGFDIVIAAIHSGFKQSKQQLTKRIIKACENKFVHIIAHPTGRLWGVRDGYEVDFDEVFKVAKDTNTHLEINAFPQRLDLNDLNSRRAKEMGLSLAIGTDAHETEQLEAMKFGISVARRGWLEKKDVINTLTLDKLLKAIKKSVLCFLFFILCFNFNAFCEEPYLYKDSRMMMGTIVEVTSSYKQAANIVFEELERIENLLSKYKSDSEISKLNQQGMLTVSPETLYIIKKAKEFYKLSRGAFDITVGPLLDLWGFTDKNYKLSEEEKIKEALKFIGSNKIILNDEKSMVKFKTSGMKIDLGAIAKGYAVDLAVESLKQKGIKSCLINAGGDIYCLGSNFDKPWKVAIKNPRGVNFLYTLELDDKAVATSGDYEQYFILNQKRYSHILNPKTGYPADTGVISVTVIADDCLTADALATAIFVLGKEKGEKLVRNFPDVIAKIIEENEL